MNMKLKSVKRKDFIDYINTYWTSESDRMYINDYSSGYKNLGNSIGLYDNNKLIGFIYYKKDITKPYWFSRTQNDKPNIIPNTYNNLWENNLLEIHPDYRFKGFGSMLVQEVYKRMPNDYVLITLSEYTNKHIDFYKKNGFTQNTYIRYSKPLFFRIKNDNSIG